MLRDRLLTRHQLRNTAAEAVDVALVLAADSSGSISNEDLARQFRGNAAAVTSDVFITGLRFAATLLHAPGPNPGFTSIGGGIDFARQTLSACRFAADWKLIDVSGDGTANDGRPITEAREEAIAVGIAINGLPIVRREPDIAGYYSRNVIGGDSAFLINCHGRFELPHCGAGTVRHRNCAGWCEEPLRLRDVVDGQFQ